MPTRTIRFIMLFVAIIATTATGCQSMGGGGSAPGNSSGGSCSSCK